MEKVILFIRYKHIVSIVGVGKGGLIGRKKITYSMSASILSAMVVSLSQSSVSSFSLSLLSPLDSFIDFFLFLFSVSSSCKDNQ